MYTVLKWLDANKEIEEMTKKKTIATTHGDIQMSSIVRRVIAIVIIVVSNVVTVCASACRCDLFH